MQRIKDIVKNLLKSPEQLVNEIAALQSTGNQYYAEGMFRVQRMLSAFLYVREDDNIYFPALIALILQNIKDRLSAESQKTAQSIIAKIVSNYPKYMSRSGEKLYGFYRTVPGGHYPHGLLLSRFDSLKLPEDADDTALIYLTSPHDRDDILFFKEKLAYHANLQRGRKVRKTLPQYEHLQAYSTWFGSDKVYVDFDVAVMSNIMSFVFRYALPLNKYDEDTLKFISDVILTDDYLDHTYLIAPWYPDARIILYHVARMLSEPNAPAMEQLKDKVVSGLHQMLRRADNFIEFAVSATSLYRLGEVVGPNPFRFPGDKEIQDFSWGATLILYTLDFIYNVKNDFLRKVVAAKALNYRFSCKAHVLALILEYSIYRIIVENREMEP